MVPVKITGYPDYHSEVFVNRERNGEKGYDIITPYYTHNNENGDPCAILVNRGWVSDDLADYRYDKEPDRSEVRGVLYRGDAKTKYSRPNVPIHNIWHNTWPE